MFEFVQPLWMLAASGMIIPVLIHLWNVREGKTLKIGSVSLLVQSSRQAARSFRLRELLLLILRCLIIIFLATMMVQPFWIQTKKAAQEKGWILLEKQHAPETYNMFRSQIDSLTKAGFQLHYFENGFPVVSVEKMDTVKDSIHADTSTYWALMQSLGQQLSPTLPVYLYTGNRLNRFTGNKPELAMNLHWQTYTPADSFASWISSASLASSDSIRVTKAFSHPAALTYTTQYIPATKTVQSGYNLNFEQGKLFLTPTDSTSGGAVTVDTAVMRIMIYTDSYNSDASYLQAAIRAVQQYSDRRLQVQMTSNVSTTPLKPDWLFWLSDKPLPTGITAGNIFCYATGKQQTTFSWVLEHDVESSAEPIALYKTIADSTKDPYGADVLWEDGFGHPLLMESNVNNTPVYTFNSRFNPQWNDLTWSSAFPVRMLQLLMPSSGEKHINQDRRIIDQQQLAPAIIGADRNMIIKNPAQKTDLSKALWIAAFVTLLLERFITYRNKIVKPA